MNTLNGLLTINLDPPYVTFHSENGKGSLCQSQCTDEDLKILLNELGLENCESTWPPVECLVRVRGHFSSKVLRSLIHTRSVCQLNQWMPPESSALLFPNR